MVVGGALVLVVVGLVSIFPADAAGESLTRNLIRLALAWYVVALCGMMPLAAADWVAHSAAGRRVRWCWTWGLVCFLAHVAAAFHFYHHWSHHDAFERTRLISGVGEGLYVSYLFIVVWTSDALWWWLWPEGYAARGAWVGRLTGGFLAFVVFNATVVYETGPIRYAALAAFAGLLIVAVLRYRGR
jgi:hypothetical protein